MDDDTSRGLWSTARLRREAGTLDYAQIRTAAGEYVAASASADGLLEDAVAGCDLFCFLEPSVATLARAKQAGITAVYSVLSRQDAEQLGITSRALRPQTYWRVRQEVIEHLERHAKHVLETSHTGPDR